MGISYITSLSNPVPCAICGRPTTRYNRLAGVADCGRDEDAAIAPVDGFGPPLRGSLRGRRWLGPRHRSVTAARGRTSPGDEAGDPDDDQTGPLASAPPR